MLRQAVFHDMDAYCKQYNMGLLDEDEWKRIKLLWAAMMRDPVIASKWEFYKGFHSASLNAVLADLILNESSDA